MAPIILDMGTGLREYGATWAGSPIEASILVTHLHWDHVQGLPFFGPVHHPNSRVQIYGPPHEGQELLTSFNGLMQPPYFPIRCEHLPEGVCFKTAWEERLAISDAKVTTRAVPHTGETNGYRIEIDGYVIAYASDHQEPIGSPTSVDEGVLELCEGADLVIHDAQFTHEELAARPDWGHCTPRYALEVAAQAGAKQLCMFHHDPWHDDDMVDALLADCTEEALDRGLDGVIAAAEGMTITFGD
jgi:phosphoribosyl 1,2-cyclic phosphodiesterase